MPPPISFTREQVIQAAFEIVQEQGLQGLSARKVAGRLKSSTAPVYSYFHSIQELEREVMRKAEERLLQYATTPYTDRVFLNMGTGVALFARDHGELFRSIFLEKNDFKDIVDEFLAALREEIRKDQRFTTMPVEDRNAMMYKMWIFTHGLATLMCVGLIEENSQEFIIDTLEDVGKAVIDAALASSHTREEQS